ncbi:MAG: glycoside hydrolase family 3 C-terminal domain-containing protein [Bacteroidales bacterium]|nr:glycoside hydrolase family 3 C-terminal domain-containing protein [Bacteroidales bacterium]
MKKALLLAATALAILSACNNGGREKEIDRILSGMTLEEKIGQMIQLEVNMITWYDPELEYASLVRMGPEKLQRLIDEGGLSLNYNASKMFANLNIEDFGTIYPFYLLSLDLNKAAGFTLDSAKVQSVFGEHHVGSILNMIGGTEASTVAEWRKALREIDEASDKYNSIPLIYGIDHVHGPTYVAGGTMFPQQIGMAATFNTSLVKELGEMNAYETRAAGLRWCFGPNMDLGVRPTWSRFYETWGEDPYITSVLAGSYASGMLGPDPDHIDAYHVLPCLKHYVGYGAPDNGIDRTPATITLQDLREKHFEPFRRAALAGVSTVMSNSSVVNGIPGVCNRELLTEWLKEELDWDGMIVTDWADVQELTRLFKVTENAKDAIALAINAGIDMIMVPSTVEYGPLLKELVDEKRVPMSRINDACRRILRMKFRAGLYDKDVEEADYPLFGSPEFAAKAYQAAVESEVLLKNDGAVLPLPEKARILVCGPNAKSMRTLSGGWTYSHQGDKVERFAASYNTILEAMQARFPNVTFSPGVEYDFSGVWSAEKEPRIREAVAAASRADYIVVCVGENTYAELQGVTMDAGLSPNQKELVKALAATGKPVIMVLNQGRPRLVSDIEPLVPAIVNVMLPSNYGGDALAALLAGDENFSGKLPFTYPSHSNAFTTYNFKVMEDRAATPGIYNYENHTNVQWWLGEGLSYTSFSYSNLAASCESFGPDDTIRFTVDVTNAGDRAGKETVLLFSSDDYASLMPDNRRLRAFDKIELQPGETRTVELSVPARDLAFVGLDGHYHLEKGSFTFMTGGQYLSLNCKEDLIF